MSLKEKNNRRNFLKSILTVGSAIGFISPVNKKNKQESNDKIKMLTADGKLVEVNKSVIEKNAGLKRASDKEVFDWMRSKHKT
jgi:hypothetical protein